MFLSKRSNGICYLFYFDDQGRRHKISTHVATKSEAQALVRNHKANIRGATPEKHSSMKLGEFLKLFYGYANVNLASRALIFTRWP